MLVLGLGFGAATSLSNAVVSPSFAAGLLAGLVVPLGAVLLLVAFPPGGAGDTSTPAAWAAALVSAGAALTAGYFVKRYVAFRVAVGRAR